MININEVPANVLWKGERVNFNALKSKSPIPGACIVTWVDDPLNIKAQMISTKTIDIADLSPAPCTEDVSKTCDCIMPNYLSGNFSMTQYCCHVCAMRRQVFQELALVESKEDPGTAGDLERFKTSVLASDTYFTEDEIADIKKRIDKIIKERGN